MFVYVVFLMFSMASDLTLVTKSIDPNMGLNMKEMTASITKMGDSFDNVAKAVDHMAGSLVRLNLTVGQMHEDVAMLNESVRKTLPVMTIATHRMERSMRSMPAMQNTIRSSTSPIRIFSQFMPF
jgi:methyl-accepting chemotaxis protein